MTLALPKRCIELTFYYHYALLEVWSLNKLLYNLYISIGRFSLLFYLVVVVGSSTGVQAGKKSFGLLLHTCWGRHGKEESSQLQGCRLILLLHRFNTCSQTMLLKGKRV